MTHSQPHESTGILLVNTGTPRSTDVADVRAYLRQFLSDPRVIDMPALGRWLLLNFVILPFRPARSAHAYRSIWTERGSPLLTHGLDLAAALQTELNDVCQVQLGFQYGEPSIPQALERFAAQGIDRIIVVPLFPHYAAASWGSAAQGAMQAASDLWVVPTLQIISPFWHTSEFLDLQAERIAQAWAQEQPDHLLLSYHGVPERHCKKTDATAQHCLVKSNCCDTLTAANRNCYRAQCMATSRALALRLGLEPAQITTSFQSRLGRVPWIRPYTDDVVRELGARKVGKLLVAEPAFVADCLETLEEIAIRARDDFRQAGGGDLVLVPSLNAGGDWAKALAAIIQSQVNLGV